MSTPLALSNILQRLHFDRLINFLATYPSIVVANAALFSSKMISPISCVLV